VRLGVCELKSSVAPKALLVMENDRIEIAWLIGYGEREKGKKSAETRCTKPHRFKLYNLYYEKIMAKHGHEDVDLPREDNI